MVPLNVIITRNRVQITKIYPLIYGCISKRFKSTNEREIIKSGTKSSSEVDTNVKHFGEKVKEGTKTASYLGIILLGVGVTGALFYTVFKELFSSKSPNNVYARAAKQCINHSSVEDKLGYPITCYGEETRRGRRQHVSHAIYMDKQGKNHLRMKFHLKGSFHSGTVHLDMVENDYGNYEYRYLFVEVDDMLKNVIVIEDNRDKLTATNLEL